MNLFMSLAVSLTFPVVTSAKAVIHVRIWVCLMVYLWAELLKTLWTHFNEILGRGRPRQRKNWWDFGGDLALTQNRIHAVYALLSCSVTSQDGNIVHRAVLFIAHLILT